MTRLLGWVNSTPTGPIGAIIRFKDEDDAVRIANDTEFGLASAVWTESVRRAHRMIPRIRAGTVWVNTPMMRELRAPFGGFKESGIGRDGPTSSIDFCTELKATIIPVDAVQMHRYGA